MVHKVSAIIPAAGYSSRMGFFKPLQSLGSSLVIENTVNTFRRAGIEDILVIVGYKSNLLIPLLKRLDVQAIFNPQYQHGMYSSILTGVRALPKDTDYFFLLPGDLPFVAPESLEKILAEAVKHGSMDILYPSTQGKRGHPPLVSTRCCPILLNSNPVGGLKEVLENREFSSLELEVYDPGILLDLDTAADYQNAKELWHSKERLVAFPSSKQCLELLRQNPYGERLVLHCQEVARVALVMAEHLNSRGYRLNLGIVMAGGLLHDMAKGEADHAGKGREIIRNMGYEEVAEVIGSHMKITFDRKNPLNEATLVYLADKMVQKNRLVSLEERMAYAKERYPDIPRSVIEERFAQAIFLKAKVEEVLQRKVEDLAGEI